ncbi:putative ABC transporter ATP-binding protein YxlF [Jeotgalicoccus saudimassiliensis]|uniref:Putative ABC transporter ATP-binding protein YxlF n=1 Tax=Jeotgalicoccus saudimassiliensis TaxID=1461582 RepID=A0A078M9C7_9STAP|nr:ABC transporter ATP-binding protein [Jeotgalicoccus saudimassiliensis]CEA02032.1 putative ABC transporter ATP-binding protein YxlF [Jeotgalicoccus saudimassiliensis]
MLEVKSVNKSYGRRRVLDDFSMTAKRGEVIGLVGENGAGKSTLLKILATLSKPDSGEVYLNGKSYRKHFKAHRKRIGYVPQDIAVWEDLTVLENMKFFARLSPVKKTLPELKGLLNNIQLDRHDTKVNKLSGGMKRKLNLAISLINDPEFLLLDEPTAGIDLKSRIEIGEFLKTMAVNNDTLIIYTSHDMSEIKEVCDRVVVIGQDSFYREILADYIK